MSDQDELKPPNDMTDSSLPENGLADVSESPDDMDEIEETQREPWELEESETEEADSAGVVGHDFMLPVDDVEVPLGAGLDIDAALASVASLSDVIAEQEAAEAAELARIEAEAQAAEEARLRREAHYFPRPPMMTLERGQLASVIPALTLITIGAWLTFALTMSDAPPDGRTIALVVLAGVGISLLAHWLSTGRWARGTSFGGLALLFGSGTIFYLSQDSGLGAAGWPLILVVIGLAMLVSGVLSRSSGGGRQTLGGLAFMVAGVAGLVVTMGMLDSGVMNIISTVGPVVLVVALLIVLLPVVFRRRG